MTKVSPSLAHCSAYTLVVSLSQLESTFCVHTERERSHSNNIALLLLLLFSVHRRRENIHVEWINNKHGYDGRETKKNVPAYDAISRFFLLSARLYLSRLGLTFASSSKKHYMTFSPKWYGCVSIFYWLRSLLLQCQSDECHHMHVCILTA